MMRDLVLESTAKRQRRWERETILPNIPSQRYVIGSVYPGAREGEELIFCRHYVEDPVGPTLTPGYSTNPTHCVITADKQGQYWIQNDTRNVARRTTRSSVYNTYVNGERVKAVEVRLLKSGDVISLGDPDPDTWTGPGHPVFCVKVKERKIASESYLQTDNDNENKISVGQMKSFADSPLANNLILENVMSYLPVKDLKNARLVCRKWKEEASKALEKRGSVSFIFDDDYVNPKNSTRVFRYLHEMRELKIRNLHISLSYHKTLLISPGEAGQKMLDDLLKLLKSSHNFSTLHLEANMQDESGLPPLFTIFQELGGKLVELTLQEYLPFFPEVVPSFPLLTNLKKFKHVESDLGYFSKKPKWASLLASLLTKELEKFKCGRNVADIYFQAFLEQGKPNLRGIAINFFEKEPISDEALHLLLSFKNVLTSLEIHIDSNKSNEGAPLLLEKLLFKHSNSLQTLVLRINSITVIKFPPFPKLGEFHLMYTEGTRIGWENGLDYKNHFPLLKKLTISPGICWNKENPVFNTFNTFLPRKWEPRHLSDCEGLEYQYSSGFQRTFGNAV